MILKRRGNTNYNYLSLNFLSRAANLTALKFSHSDFSEIILSKQGDKNATLWHVFLEKSSSSSCIFPYFLCSLNSTLEQMVGPNFDIKHPFKALSTPTFILQRQQLYPLARSVAWRNLENSSYQKPTRIISPAGDRLVGTNWNHCSSAILVSFKLFLKCRHFNTQSKPRGTVHSRLI